MPRKRVSKNVHTRPDMAGPQNMTDDRIKRDTEKVEDGLMDNLLDLWEVAGEHIKQPRKSAWTAEGLYDTIRGYFEFSAERNLKPTKSAIIMYIGCSASQYYDWANKPEVYEDISEVVRWANAMMENQYINRGEKYPTFNIFMLKTKYGYEETSKLEITGDIKSDEVADRIKQLGIKRDEG